MDVMFVKDECVTMFCKMLHWYVPQTNTSCCSMTHQPINKQLHSVEITLLVKSHHMSIAIGKMNWKLVMFDNPDQ
jgi:hypothetical protein